jgi:hypothetical protein
VEDEETGRGKERRNSQAHATRQKMRRFYDKKEKEQKLSKEELQGSKMWLLNEKADILKSVAASMTAAFAQAQAHSAKRIEKSRLEQNTGTFMMNLLSVPDGEKGKRARTFFNKQITENEEWVEDSKEWFLEIPSPSKKQC